VCDLETSYMKRPWPTGGRCAKNRRKKMFWWSVYFLSLIYIL